MNEVLNKIADIIEQYNNTSINDGVKLNEQLKNFELQVAKYLSREFKYEIRRTPNSGGLSIKGDIIATQGILS